MTHDEDLEIATRLRTVLARADRLLARQVVGSGLTRTQFSVLGAVARTGELRLSELVEREGLNPTMLSRIVGALEAAGWVIRRAHPEDGRAVVVQVTEEGAGLYARLQRERTGLLLEHLETLPPPQARTLRAALPLLEDLVEHLRTATARVPA